MADLLGVFSGADDLDCGPGDVLAGPMDHSQPLSSGTVSVGYAVGSGHIVAALRRGVEFRAGSADRHGGVGTDAALDGPHRGPLGNVDGGSDVDGEPGGLFPGDAGVRFGAGAAPIPGSAAVFWLRAERGVRGSVLQFQRQDLLVLPDLRPGATGALCEPRPVCGFHGDAVAR